MSFILDLVLKNRALVVGVTMLAALVGIWSLIQLPIDAVPDITNKQVQINTTAPALSPNEVEKQVTLRIETALAGIVGLEATRSLSRNGFSQVTAIFTEKTDIYFARQQVNERLQDMRANLPPDTNPTIGPITTGLGEIYMWSVAFTAELDATAPYLTPEGDILTSVVEKAAYLRTIQDWIIRPQVKSIAGVAGVDTLGGYIKQYQVQPDPMKLSSFGVPITELVSALQANNAGRGAGTIERNGEGIIVRSDGRLETIDEIGAVTVTTRRGVPVHIRDLAEIVIGGEIRTGSASVSGREAVIGTALMLVGANSRTVAKAVNQRINDLRSKLPPGIEIKTLLDRSQLVDATISTVAKNLGEGAILVIVILFLMLGNFRAACITAMVIPISMLLTAAGMLKGGISANLMSLGAVDFGLIVDGAVIVTENTLHHIARKQSELGRILSKPERLAAVRAASMEMVRPSLYGQSIIILVYLPLLSFTGVEGKMFEPMALTVIIALAAAFILSISFVPAMLALAIAGPVVESNAGISAWIKQRYAPVLALSFSRPVSLILAAGVLFVLSLGLFSRLGQEFIPSLDEKNLAMHALRIPSTSLAQSQAMQLDVERAIGAVPEVDFAFSKTGTADLASDPMPPNASDTFIILKPIDQWPDRSLTKDAVIARIEAAVERLPGNSYEFTQPIQMRFNELIAGVRGEIAVKIYGDDFDTMLQAANKVAEILRATSGAVDVNIEQIEGLTLLDITASKPEIARFGLTLASIQDVIGTAIGGREAGVIFKGDRSFDVVVRLSDQRRSDIDAVGDLPILVPGAQSAGQSVPLSRLVSFKYTEGPNQVSRENGKRRVVVTANVRDKDIASVVNQARSTIDAQVKLPPAHWIEWGGQYESLAAARQRMAVVVPLVLASIFLLLLRALGSARDTAIVFSAVPLALTGGVLALWLRGIPFSISAAVGFIALSGIAVLNGLVMMSYINTLIIQGMDRRLAIQQGALARVRPVIMTALVASLGFVPMAIATGTGAEVQRPIATVVIGGLVTSTLLTLLLLPTLYAKFGSHRIMKS